MFLLVFGYFLVEMVVGYMCNSLALIADACHMLSDGLCLVVAIVAIRVGQKTNTDKVLKANNTFGWSRAELMGGLINAIFLLALCLIIFIESLKKFIEPSAVDRPLIVCIVGGIGLAMNVMQLCLLGEDGHGHSHGGGGGGGEQLNMRGVYLHVMGDLFGSVVVILSAGITAWYNKCTSIEDTSCLAHNDAILCGEFLEHHYENETITSIAINNVQLDNTTIGLMFPIVKTSWIAYVDPVTSVILTLLIVFTTLKTVRGKFLRFSSLI